MRNQHFPPAARSCQEEKNCTDCLTGRLHIRVRLGISNFDRDVQEYILTMQVGKNMNRRQTSRRNSDTPATSSIKDFPDDDTCLETINAGLAG